MDPKKGERSPIAREYKYCPATNRTILIKIAATSILISVVFIFLGFALIYSIADSNSLETCSEPPCQKNRNQGIGFVVTGFVMLLGCIFLILVLRCRDTERSDTSSPHANKSSQAPSEQVLDQPTTDISPAGPDESV